MMVAEIVWTLGLIFVIYIIFTILLKITEGSLIKKTKTKKQRSNVLMFSRLINYVFLIILAVFAASYYSGSLSGLSIGLGMLSAALGWALQRPISGIAAWLMILFKKPFYIGDRVIINDVRGDVIDVSLTHISIAEIGGIVPGEENSGRITLVPNSVLFETNVVNYTHSKDEYILDQVSFNMTYESSIARAKTLSLEAATKITGPIIDITGKKPYIRTFFQENGLIVIVRYFSPVKQLEGYSSRITEAIHKKIMKSKRVNFAYPHMDVLMR